MLAQIRNSRPFRFTRVVLVVAASALASCATKQEPQLISSQTGRESSLPWNQQQKWENQGQFGGLAERLQGGGGR